MRNIAPSSTLTKKNKRFLCKHIIPWYAHIYWLRFNFLTSSMHITQVFDENKRMVIKSISCITLFPISYKNSFLRLNCLIYHTNGCFRCTRRRLYLLFEALLGVIKKFDLLKFSFKLNKTRIKATPVHNNSFPVKEQWLTNSYMEGN